MPAADLEKFAPRQQYFELDYLKAILRLLPLGSIWVTLVNAVGSPTAGNTFVTLFSCFAAELARLEVRCMTLFREQVPGMSSEMLADWERVAGMPEVGTTLAATTAERQNLVHAKLYSDEEFGLTEDYYIAYAATLGYAIRFYPASDDSDAFYVAPVGVDALNIGSRMGDRLGSSSSLSYIIVKVVGGLIGTEQLQAAINYRKPAHILLGWQDLIFNRLIVYDFTSYTFAEIGIGTLTEMQATDSADYAVDHANLITAYGFKEMSQIYLDDLETKRPTNVAYTWGPVTLSDGMPSYDCLWAIYATKEGGLFAKNITTDVLYNLRTAYTDLDDLAVSRGFISIISAAFDMSGTPVLAVENEPLWDAPAPFTDVTTITTWTSTEGFNNFAGYSPLVICNGSYVPESNPDALDLDAIVLYLSESGDNSGWNYNDVTSASDQWEYDNRHSRTIYAYFQRNLFNDECIVCTTDFDIAYIESAWFSGDPDNFTVPDDVGREYCLYISVRDLQKNRHTLKSEYYFKSNYYPVGIPDTVGLSASVVSGGIVDLTVSSPDTSESIGLVASIYSGALESMGDGLSVTEYVALTSQIISGSLATTIESTGTLTDSVALSPSVSGSIITSVIPATIDTHTIGMSSAIVSGELTNL